MVDLSSPVTRRHDLARSYLDEAYERHGMMVLTTGLAGMGKTWFLRELIGLAQSDDRWQVSFASADEMEREIPYAFLERLLATPLDTTLQPVAVGQQALQTLRGQSLAGRVAVIDDAQWIDPASELVMRYLLPRLTRQDMLVAVAVRFPYEPGSLAAHLERTIAQNPLDRHLRMDPLTEVDIRELVTERFGVIISARSTEGLLGATGGSFLLLDQILGNITADEVSRLHRTWDMPIRGVDAARNPLLAAYQGLGLQTAATVEIVATAAHDISRTALRQVAGALGEPVDVTAGIEAGLLRESGFGSSILPVHSLVASAIRQSLPPERRRRISRALAEVTEGYRSICFALEGAEQLDPQLLARVREHVAGAAEGGAFANAASVLRGALPLVAGDVALRQELLTDLALVSLRAKAGYLLLDLVDDLAALPESMLTDCINLNVSAYRVDVPFPQEKVAAFLQQPATSPDDLTIQAYMAFMLAIMAMRGADQSAVPMLLARAQEIFTEAPSDPAALADSRLAWMMEPEAYALLLECLAIVPLLQRRYRMAELRERIAALEPRIDALPDGSLKVDALVTIAGSCMHAGDTAAGLRLAQRAVGLLARVPPAWTAGTARIVLADALTLTGDLAGAADVVALFSDICYDVVDLETRPMNAGLDAILRAITGRPGARQCAEQAQVLRDLEWEGYAPDLAILARCEIARAAGEPLEVLAACDDEWAEQIVTTRRGFLTYRAHALIDLGRLSEAAELLERLGQWRGTRWQECWGRLEWLQARLAQAQGRADAAEAAYRSALAGAEHPLATALTAADFGAFLAERSPREAGAWLRQAVATLEQIGAAAYLPRPQEALAALADAGHQQHARLVASLTPREREIAELLADGLSNQAIADALVVTVATARFHVSNVLRKLGITSRAQVSRALRGP